MKPSYIISILFASFNLHAENTPATPSCPTGTEFQKETMDCRYRPCGIQHQNSDDSITYSHYNRKERSCFICPKEHKYDKKLKKCNPITKLK